MIYFYGATEPVNRIHQEGCRFAGRRQVKWDEISDPERFIDRLARVHRAFSVCSFCCKDIKPLVQARVEARKASRNAEPTPDAQPTTVP
jgi:hypothetical protein